MRLASWAVEDFETAIQCRAETERKMTLNDAVFNNILNFDAAEYRITISRNGNLVEDYTGNPGFSIDVSEVEDCLIHDSGIVAGLVNKDVAEDLHTILVGIAEAFENCDLDFLVENLDKFVATDSDGTIYQFYVDIFNVDFNF